MTETLRGQTQGHQDEYQYEFSKKGNWIYRPQDTLEMACANKALKLPL